MFLGKEEVDDLSYLENTVKNKIFQPRKPFYKSTKRRKPFYQYPLISINQ